MLNVVIILLILVGLIIHRYLTAFWEHGLLPSPGAFLIFANLFAVIYLINFIWILGFMLGVVAFLLAYFQVIFASILWPFLLPSLASDRKKTMNFEVPKVNQGIFALWTWIIIALGSLFVVNIFVSEYSYLSILVVDFFNGDYIAPVLWMTGAIIASNLARSYTLSKFLGADA